MIIGEIFSSYGKIYENIDVSKWHKGIDIKRAIDIINWTIEGLAENEQKKSKLPSFSGFNYDEILADLDIYLGILKNSFYK